MPNTLEINKDIYKVLTESFGKDALKEKIDEILLSGIENRIESFTREILKFEEKYGVSFKEFEKKWDEGKINNKHSHEIEADFMDWEMLEQEKRELLSALAKLKDFKKK